MKITHHTNSENGDNSWVAFKGNTSSNDKKKKNTKIGRKENSAIRKKPQKHQSKAKQKEVQMKHEEINEDEEEEKIVEEIDFQDSYSYKFEINNSSPPKKNNKKNSQIDQKNSKGLNKTETMMGQNRKSNNLKAKIIEFVPSSDPNSGMKTNATNFNDQKFMDSRDKIAFEDSLISGTKIDIPGQKKTFQKKAKPMDEKRQKIEEIQK